MPSLPKGKKKKWIASSKKTTGFTEAEGDWDGDAEGLADGLTEADGDWEGLADL